MEQTLPPMINEKQAALVLSVSVAALRRWRHDGRGPQFAHIERCVRYDVRELTRFLERNTSVEPKKTPRIWVTNGQEKALRSTP
jgi:hypothetical protein